MCALLGEEKDARTLVRDAWAKDLRRSLARGVIEGKIREAIKGRLRIQNASDFEPYLKLDQELALVEEALDRPRFYGDLVVSAFFGGSNDRRRKGRLDELAEQYNRGMGANIHGSDLLSAGAKKTLERILRGPPTVPAAAAPPSPQATPTKPTPSQITAPPRPTGVPPGSMWNPSRKQFRSPDGQLFDVDGKAL